MARRAVFLDRDGVINAYAYNPEFGTFDSPAHPDEFNLLPGVLEGVAKLNSQGFLAIVVSNQPGIAKGHFTEGLLEEITGKMEALVEKSGGKLDAVYYCPHHPEGSVQAYRQHCQCRKPDVGLFERAAQDWQIDLSRSYMIGDGVVDLLAGRRAGTKTVLVSPQKCYVCSGLRGQGIWPDWVAGDLLEAVDLIQGAETTAASMSTSGQSGRSCAWERDGSTYCASYLQEAIEVLRQIDSNSIERIANLLADVRDRGGRLFFLGVGGGAGHASHAVCDFRKIAQIEAYTPVDNVSELTARINDEGWETSYANSLRGSKLSSRDAVFVFSVGGGDLERNISSNLVRALEYARSVGATICGVVGRDGGFTARIADACVVVPVVNPATITPHTEGFQAVIWHLLVSHPRLKVTETKWESTR
jgi:D-sedoheptulose 7-phosphate isomerase